MSFRRYGDIKVTSLVLPVLTWELSCTGQNMCTLPAIAPPSCLRRSPLWDTHPTVLTSLTSLKLSAAPNSIASSLELPPSTNPINYTNPWKTDHFMSTWPNPTQPLSLNIHHKKLLTQCDSETKTKGVVGEKIQCEIQCVLFSPSLVTKPDAI